MLGGVLCCGSVDSAAAALQRIGQPLGDDNKRALVGFGISARYADLRKHLGLAVA